MTAIVTVTTTKTLDVLLKSSHDIALVERQDLINDTWREQCLTTAGFFCLGQN